MTGRDDDAVDEDVDDDAHDDVFDTLVDGTPAIDPSILIQATGSELFGEEPSLTQAQVAEKAGVSVEQAWALWRYLGFPEADQDKVMFTDADVDAVRTTMRLTELQILDPEVLPQFVRAMGRTFARLADWQTRLLLDSLAESDLDEPPMDVLSEVIPMVEQVQGYIWRRHLLDRASRIALSTSGQEGSDPTCVGFVDIVGYTSTSRQLSPRELSSLVETFERTVSELVQEHGGQVIKTIGDEVMFSVDDPVQTARLALELVERADEDEDFPKVRVGAANGPVVARLGDVYGSVVNLASRLTSIARPGRVLVDKQMAELLRDADEDHDEFRLRRTRRINVKGFEHVELWSLKRQRSSSTS